MDEQDHNENDKDLADVMAEEKSRGRRRRPVDTEARKRTEKRRRQIAKALQEGDERRFLTALRESGMKDESPEFANAVGLFREALRKRRT
jgi:23S rRNA pseudoU1915 N3-methylase RlmH